MDNSLDPVAPEDLSLLSYDDTVAYEEQIPAQGDVGGTSLATRIGSTKVYLLSELSTAKVGKRKHADSNEGDESGREEDDNMNEDSPYRANAILLHGPPISHLPTARIFAYSTHFDVHPLGLEWVDDNTCVLVFDSKTAARTSYSHLQKSIIEDADMDGYITAKPIPMALWPPEERINKSLGKGEGLKGVIRMRWALVDDVKKKGAKKDSEFYRKHGVAAGKEIYPERGERPQKRRRGDLVEDEAVQRAQLDDDLDEFLREDVSEEPEIPPSPPSKMRSDYIANDGRTLLERTSVMRLHEEFDTPLEARITAPLPHRARDPQGRRERGRRAPSKRAWDDDDLQWRRGSPHNPAEKSRNRRGGNERPRKSQQELDDELEAFLNEK